MNEWLRRELAAIRERARTGDEIMGEPGRVLVIADRSVLLEHIHDLVVLVRAVVQAVDAGADAYELHDDLKALAETAGVPWSRP